MRLLPVHSALYLTLGLAIPLGSQAATAPTASQIPTTADPAFIGRNLLPPATPIGTASVSVPGFKPQPIAPTATRSAFVLNDLVISGATVYGNEQIENLFRNYVGRRITLADLQQMADQITLKYRQDGYVLTQAIVPAQIIKNGEARIRVVEGFVNQIYIQGDPKGARALLESYSNRIKQVHPLNISTLERYTLLANDIPGVTVKAVLSPAHIARDELASSEVTPGAADLTFIVEQHTASGYVSFDNRGTRYTGPNEYSLGGNVNSIFRSGDISGTQALITPDTKELQYFKLYHQTPIGNNGLLFNAAASFSHSQPNYLRDQLDLHGQTNSISAGVTYPILRSRNQNLFFNAGIDATHSKSDSDAFNTNIYNDQLRSVRLSTNYDLVDNWSGINQIGGQFSHGLSILGASKSGANDLSRPDGKSDYTKVNFNASRLQVLGHNFSLLTATEGQYAFTPLLSAEEFSFGGSQFGRAYDPAELVGDHGLAGKAELRYDAQQNWRVIQNEQFFTYYDIGKVWNKESTAQIQTASAASAGIGLRTNFTHYFAGSIELDKPLTKPVETENSKNPRIFFTLTLSGDTPSNTVATPLPQIPALAAGTGLKQIGTGFTPVVNSAVTNHSQVITDNSPNAATIATTVPIEKPTAPAPHVESTATNHNNSQQFEGLTEVNN